MSETTVAAADRPASRIGDFCGRLLPSWPLIVGLAALGRILAEPQRVLRDPDTYLHLAAGRWILAHAALPTRDPFSYTMAGAGGCRMNGSPRSCWRPPTGSPAGAGLCC